MDSLLHPHPLHAARSWGQWASCFFLLASPWRALERLWGSSVGYTDSGEPLCLPALFHVSPCPRAATTGAVALLGTCVSSLVSNRLIWLSS